LTAIFSSNCCARPTMVRGNVCLGSTDRGDWKIPPPPDTC
jgi:hypothetical protein